MCLSRSACVGVCARVSGCLSPPPTLGAPSQARFLQNCRGGGAWPGCGLHPLLVPVTPGAAFTINAASSRPVDPGAECFAKAGKMEPNQLFDGFGPLQPAVAAH